MRISLFQLDANLIEGEPELYNRLAWKKYKDNKSAASKFKNLRRRGKPVSKTRQDEQCQCGACFGVVKTQIFFAKVNIGKYSTFLFKFTLESNSQEPL